MPIAFVSPFTNTTNPYIDQHKALLEDIGLEVRPLRLKCLVGKDLWALFSRKNCLIFHWIETRPFNTTGPHPRLSLKGFLEWLIYFMIALVSRARVVYVMHNHAAHDTTGFMNALSVALIKAFAKVANTRIVHDPSFCEPYQANYLPHPLYWDNPHGQIPASGSETTVRGSNLRCGVFGAIRSYKKIDEVLLHWPQSEQLVIRGRASEPYLAALNKIIDERALRASVSLQPGFMSDAEFSEEIAKVDVLLLPHSTEANLVSGAFFEGIGRVPVIIARASPFILWAASRNPCVIPFESAEELPNALETAQQLLKNQNRTEASQAREFALQEFGWERCRQHYHDFFNRTAQTKPSPKETPAEST